MYFALFFIHNAKWLTSAIFPFRKELARYLDVTEDKVQVSSPEESNLAVQLF
jgi:hypothetical protein